MTFVAILAAVVVSVTHQPVVLHCGFVPQAEVFGLQGAASAGDDQQIWLESCWQAYLPTEIGLLIFAHEILHLLHPGWPEAKIHYWDEWYANHVIRWKLRNEKRRRALS